MRPEYFNPLFQSITKLNGVGPKTAPLIAKAIGGEIIKNAAFHLPFNLIDRSQNYKISDAPENINANFEITIDSHEPAFKNRPYRVIVSDETGFMALVFFNPNPKYIQSRLPIGAKRIISGEISRKFGQNQMVHPNRILNLDDPALSIKYEAIYPNTGGLSQKTLAKACQEAANLVHTPHEWLDATLIARENWQDFANALNAAHNPQNLDEIKPDFWARRRLAYDEALARQIILHLNSRIREKTPAKILETGDFSAKFIDALPYTPTNAQLRAFSQISQDVAKSTPMMRLLQGDVGAGKTLVAAYALGICAKNKFQGALMAPTEILARQHFTNLEPLFAQLGIKSAILTGRDKGTKRKEILRGLINGEIQILIGTHALFQDGVEFANLSLVIIDEQHRFGVNARRALVQKGSMPHTLSMSATPIPRTLAMSIYGDMDVSILDEKPKNRIAIETRLFDLEKIHEIEAAVARAIKTDDRVYWVCPLVEESEKLEISSTIERFNQLKSRFGNLVEIVHGQMKAQDKDIAMARFKNGEAKILVATTVIEVGVDVKEASIIIIEHAERFGLAQLHQLRGRVGRGDKPSHCLLLYQSPLSENGLIRMKKLRDTDDGFQIAETDFELRGAGDLLGLRQTGLPDFHFVDLFAHRDLLEIARQDARLMLQKDPELVGLRGMAIRELLEIFELAPTILAD
jgi:ATP-dependent DNA helicase RecG